MWHRDQRFVAFFFNDTATTEIYTLSLHDALPISDLLNLPPHLHLSRARGTPCHPFHLDRKSTRLNSSHSQMSYAVFCLKNNREKRQDLKGSPPDPRSYRGQRIHELT